MHTFLFYAEYFHDLSVDKKFHILLLLMLKKKIFLIASANKLLWQ
jgi:hypothetical protein